ncbi:hypothetical protein GT347_19665 [Xylophilus rhododendri]|uniref:Uncharacterized protein n=1 Tax=Xylophilus rhododendri TaxID=2697032 RepID=A0A857JAJ5_9BURK|nr:hypothetical protein [Xylophilus rhododendri]QHJ00003.1 hypothetical protein GT347_19665 [Xylophilus rhododendri]
MFEPFTTDHEQTLQAWLEGGVPADASALTPIIEALAICQTRLVERLKSESDAEVRHQCRVLYQGLTQFREFLAADASRSSSN